MDIFRKRIIRAIFLSFSMPLYVLVSPFVLLVRIIKPVFQIRFGPIRNDVIGHFAFDTENYLTERDINKTKMLDLFYFQCDESPNNQWELMVKRKFNHNSIIKYFDRVNRMIPGWEKHFARLQDNGSRDIKNLFMEAPCHISFTDEELQRGHEYLRKIGVQPGQKFVCMIARDPAYKEQYLGSTNIDWSYHSYRDSRISNYVQAAKNLVEQDYFVFRIGKGVKRRLEINNNRIIDYSNSEEQSDFLDIYLSTHCSFFINGESGLTTVPQAFRIPIVFVNLSAVEYAMTFNSNIISIPKKYWLIEEKRFMTFKEIYTSGAGRFLRTEQYEKLGIELIENTPEEIMDVSMEMHKRLNGTWETSDEDKTLQIHFWELFPESELHGEIHARIGAEFLRKNRVLLS